MGYQHQLDSDGGFDVANGSLVSQFRCSPLPNGKLNS
jgi:hypothetical protein